MNADRLWELVAQQQATIAELRRERRSLREKLKAREAKIMRLREALRMKMLGGRRA